MQPLQSFFELTELVLKGKPFLLYISTPWCQPCKRIRPLVEKNIAPLITVATVDMTTVDKDFADELRSQGVNTVPKFLLSDGKGALVTLPNNVAIIQEAVEALLREDEDIEDASGR